MCTRNLTRALTGSQQFLSRNVPSGKNQTRFKTIHGKEIQHSVPHNNRNPGELSATLQMTGGTCTTPGKGHSPSGRRKSSCNFRLLKNSTDSPLRTGSVTDHMNSRQAHFVCSVYYILYPHNKGSEKKENVEKIHLQY